MKIFLVGMMGSGKTYWSKIISKKLKIPFYDLDSLIEILEEQTINEIFENSGEEYFRKIETKILKWFVQKKTFVLATGGGTPCFNNNISWMNKTGLTVWLNDSVENIFERLKSEKENRPAIKNLSDIEIEKFIYQKLVERNEYYSQSKIQLEENGINEKNMLLQIKKNKV